MVHVWDVKIPNAAVFPHPHGRIVGKV